MKKKIHVNEQVLYKIATNGESNHYVSAAENMAPGQMHTSGDC